MYLSEPDAARPEDHHVASLGVYGQDSKASETKGEYAGGLFLLSLSFDKQNKVLIDNQKERSGSF